MKLLHTADWHLGNTFHTHNRLSEHRHFLAWLVKTLVDEQPDALLVTGDVFDTANPSAASEELFYDFLLEATRKVPGLQIVVTAGNHDSAGRLEAPAALLKTHNIYVRGKIRFLPSGEPDFAYHLLPLADRHTGQPAAVCMALPYLRSSDYPLGLSQADGLAYFFDGMRRALNASPFADLPRLAAAHFYATGAEIAGTDHSERLVVGGQDCVNAAVVGKGVAYTALGHIHKAQHIKGEANAWYAGSALPMSFTERNYRHGVNRITIDEQGRAEVERIDYEPLRGLLTLPQQGNSLRAEEVFAEIDKLPLLPRGETAETEDNSTADNYPYLEIRIEERQPEPTLMHRVMEALRGHAVHFCRMQRILPGETGEAALREETQISASAEALAALTPMSLAEKVFNERYGEPMPEPLAERFKRALNEEEAE